MRSSLRRCRRTILLRIWGDARVLIPLLFLIALALRVLYILQGHEVPPLDTPDYDGIALNLLQGHGFIVRGMQAWRPPLYPVFLAGIYGLFGYHHLAVKLLQALIGALMVPVLYWTGREVEGEGLSLGEGVGKIGALLMVFYGPFVGRTNEVMTETVFAFLLVTMGLLLIRGMRCEGYRNEIGGGILLGLAILTRAILLGFTIVLPLLGLFRRRARMAKKMAVASCCALFVVLPWTVRNYMVFRAFVPVSTMGGFVFSRSNSFLPDWKQERAWWFTVEFAEQIPSEIERDRYWWREGWRFIRSHPGFYLRLVGEKFLRLWYVFHPRYNVWFGTIAPFALLGAIWNIRRERWELFYGLILFSIGMFTLVFYGCARYRLPLEPFFILFAVSGLHGLFARYRGARMPYVLVASVAGLNGALYAASGPIREGLVGLLRTWGLK